MYHLGINCFHANSSIAITKDETIIFAIEEERLNRKKNWFGFPKESIEYALEKFELTINDFRSISINFDQKQNLSFKIYSLIKNPLLIRKLKIVNKSKYKKVIESLKEIGLKDFSKLKFFDHHESHLFYSFYSSGFKNALVISIDGFGDQKSSLIGLFEKNNFKIIDSVYFPHSLGIFYQAFTQYLGFKNYGDEYKVMGMSAYGKKYINEMDNVIKYCDKNLFKLNLDYFNHHKIEIETHNINQQIEYKNLYSTKLKTVFSKFKDFDVAYSVQKKFEEIVFKIINKYSHLNINLCLTGGCALNSLSNGKVLNNCSNIKNFYVGATPHDAGGAIGSIYANFHKNYKKNIRNLKPIPIYTGPDYTNNEIRNFISNFHDIFEIKKLNKKDLISEAVKELSKGKVIGWFQGKLEWGPRSLGNRSILANPTFKNMKALINKKIKRRESFRPFAPSILESESNNWFDAKDCSDPYMVKVLNFKNSKKKLIPSVVHKDGTGRLQTVNKKNGIYYELISNFFYKCKIPILLNTSFNENEPVVTHPNEAIDCFLRNDLDSLFLGNYYLKKNKYIRKKLSFKDDVSIICITYNEDIHIERLIKNLLKYNKNIYVIDSFSNDNTVEILNKYKIKYMQRKFDNYSNQINYAIKNNPFKKKYTLRIDADELLNSKLIDELKSLMNKNFFGIFVKRHITFLGSLLKYGNQSESFILRLWKTGYGYCSDDFVDEQIIVSKGMLAKTNNYLIENNLKSLSDFIKKHLKYAKLESSNYIKINNSLVNEYSNFSRNRQNKYNFYYKTPIFLRSFFYLIYIIIIKKGFKDGISGLIYYFIQGFCYRFLVDILILFYKLKKFKP